MLLLTALQSISKARTCRRNTVMCVISTLGEKEGGLTIYANRADIALIVMKEGNRESGIKNALDLSSTLDV